MYFLSSEVGSVVALLDNVSDNMSEGLLSILVANVSGLKEGDYSVDILCETNRAVVAFNSPAGEKDPQLQGPKGL